MRVCVCVGGVGRRAVCCFHSAHMIKHTGPSTVPLSLDGALMALQVPLSVCVCAGPSGPVGLSSRWRRRVLRQNSSDKARRFSHYYLGSTGFVVLMRPARRSVPFKDHISEQIISLVTDQLLQTGLYAFTLSSSTRSFFKREIRNCYYM